MVRRLMLLAGTSLLGLVFSAPATAAPRASAALERCHPSPDPVQRYASFSGWMRSLRGGRDRMEMRFDLFRRAAGAVVFRRLAAPGLGVWNHADPGVSRFKFRQKVENLGVPATYRAVVSFRWITAEGRLFARAQHVTPICQQPDLRPNLRIGRIAPQGRSYFVTVRNDGRSAARGFAVSLSVAGVPVAPAQAVGILRAGQRTTLVFTGRRCSAGDPIVATADPGGLVVERDESDNRLSATCPSLGTSSSR